MLRKMLGVFTAVAAALVVVGVAWASGDTATTTTMDDQTTSSSFDDSTSTVVDSSSTSEGGASTSIPGSSTSSTSATVPSTTIPGSSTTVTEDDDSTSTTIPGSSTSTTFDDDDDHDEKVPDGDYAYSVATAGSVVVRVTDGNISLLSVSASVGWSYTIENNQYDEVEVRFTKGESEASIEVEPGDGKLDVEIEFKTG